MKQFAVAVLLTAAFAARSALALPPPEELEATKAKAGLIAICRVETIVEHTPARITRFPDTLRGWAVLTVVQVLSPVEGSGRSPTEVRVLVRKPPTTPAEELISAKSAGGTGYPQPVVGETALVFLQDVKAAAWEHAYGIICGTRGYIVLKTATAEERDATVTLLEQYREFATKIPEENLRKVMAECYRKALDYVRK